MRWLVNLLITGSLLPGLVKSTTECSNPSSHKFSSKTGRSDALAVTNRRGIYNNEVNVHTFTAGGNDQRIQEAYQVDRRALINRIKGQLSWNPSYLLNLYVLFESLVVVIRI